MYHEHHGGIDSRSMGVHRPVHLRSGRRAGAQGPALASAFARTRGCGQRMHPAARWRTSRALEDVPRAGGLRGKALAGSDRGQARELRDIDAALAGVLADHDAPVARSAAPRTHARGRSRSAIACRRRHEWIVRVWISCDGALLDIEIRFQNWLIEAPRPRRGSTVVRDTVSPPEHSKDRVVLRRLSAAMVRDSIPTHGRRTSADSSSHVATDNCTALCARICRCILGVSHIWSGIVDLGCVLENSCNEQQG
jgi:hypothetical protein